MWNIINIHPWSLMTITARVLILQHLRLHRIMYSPLVFMPSCRGVQMMLLALIAANVLQIQEDSLFMLAKLIRILVERVSHSLLLLFYIIIFYLKYWTCLVSKKYTLKILSSRGNFQSCLLLTVKSPFSSHSYYVI